MKQSGEVAGNQGSPSGKRVGKMNLKDQRGQIWVYNSGLPLTFHSSSLPSQRFMSSALPLHRPLWMYVPLPADLLGLDVPGLYWLHLHRFWTLPVAKCKYSQCRTLRYLLRKMYLNTVNQQAGWPQIQVLEGKVISLWNNKVPVRPCRGGRTVFT